MTDTPLPEHLLACPRCDSALEGLHCASCKVDYPAPGGLPWLFADPAATRSEWRNRYDMERGRLDRDAERVRRARKALAKDASPLTRTRLDTLLAGLTRQREALGTLLDELLAGAAGKLESHLALRTRLPVSQGIQSYAPNLFRDWCWGEAENCAALDALLAFGPAAGRVLVLGAGAGRLAYDLHRAGEAELTVALDNNPLLARVCRDCAAGATVTLVEFPLAPRSADAVAIERRLAAPQAAGSGFTVVLGSALRAPFVAGSFDLVVTPWLVDVLEAPPREFLPHVNRLLKPGGRWLMHGSLAAEYADPRDNLCLEELAELARATGFDEWHADESPMDYLCCPDSRHGRRETVITASARKTAEHSPAARHQALPDWLVTGRGPIPALASFRQQAMATRIHAFIMSLIDGQRSLKDMARVLEEQQLMTRDDAETAIRGFLIKMYDEAGGG